MLRKELRITFLFTIFIEDIELLGIKAGRHNIQRLIFYTMFKCYWNPNLNFEDNVHVNFDWYHPRNCFRFALNSGCNRLGRGRTAFDPQRTLQQIRQI